MYGLQTLNLHPPNRRQKGRFAYQYKNNDNNNNNTEYSVLTPESSLFRGCHLLVIIALCLLEGASPEGFASRLILPAFVDSVDCGVARAERRI